MIEYLTEFEIPSSDRHSAAQFEVLTGYMPAVFSQFWALDVRGGQVSPVPISDGPGEQPFPIIMATPNGSHAMGIYSPDTPQPEYAEAGYGRWRFVADKVVKWNQVARITNPVGTYRFRSYVIVGSLEEVVTQMIKLHARIELHLREKIICTKRP